MLKLCLHCHTHVPPNHQCQVRSRQRNQEPAKLSRSSPEYKRARDQAKKRDHYRCTQCGYGGYVEAHHIDHNPLNNHINNLTTLCRHCHGGARVSSQPTTRKHPDLVFREEQSGPLVG